jgi:threonine aldolase
MGAAMLDAAVGDDVYGEDPTVRALEARVAEMLGKGAALYCPTATMANLLAVGAQCARGDEVLLGSESHLYVYEQGGASWLMGAVFHAVTNAPDGTLPLEAVRAALAARPPGDAHFARPALLALENTQNRCGGAVLPVAYMDDAAALAAEAGLLLHCDGARLFNAAAALGCAPARLVRGCNTVQVCLSKGLGAPLGALLAGSAATVARARRLRKALGGGMRQAGVVAAAGLAALDEQLPKLPADHARARALARALAAVPGLEPQAAVDSNIVYVALAPARLCAAAWAARAAAAARRGERVCDAASGAAVEPAAVPHDASDAVCFAALLAAVARVRVGTYGSGKVRAVTHHQCTDEDVESLARGAAIVARLMATSP